MQQQIEARKKELEQSLVQHLLNSLVQELEKDLEVNQNFFFGDNVDHKQNNPKIIPTKVKFSNKHLSQLFEEH